MYVAVKGEDYVSVVNYAEAAEVAELTVDTDPVAMETWSVSAAML